MNIHYIHGEDNTVADTLLHLPDDPTEVDLEEVDVSDTPLHWDNWLAIGSSCNTILTISADESFLWDMHLGYKNDKFCQKLSIADESIPGICFKNDLWYIGD